MSETPACLRCHTPMIAGLLVDWDGNVPGQASWVEGEPRGGWRRAFGGAAGGERPRLAVTGFRCPACGYLELRAQDTL